jgi:VWFA-related protein
MRPSTQRSRIAILLCVLLASTAAAPDQKNMTVVQERVSATLIEVPVTALGKDGKPLGGLTEADFELYDNGKKQKITGFDVIDLQKALAPTTENPFPAPPPPIARRHWLLVFDLSYASPTALIRARDGALAFINTGLAPSDLAGVATLSVEHGWKLVENFTADKKQLAYAIDTLGVVQAGVRTSDPLAFASFLPGEASIESQAGKRKSDGGQELREILQDVQRMNQQASDARERGRVRQQLSSLGWLAQVLDSVRGRKYVLFFSEGFESRLLTGNAGNFATPMGQTNATQDTSADAAIDGQLWKVDNDTRMGSSAMASFLEASMALFRRSDVVLNAVDISGLRAGNEITSRTGQGTDGLLTMANETNGDLIHNANQLSGQLQKMVDRTALVYILAFQPSLAKPGQFHELKVKVNAPTSKVVYRTGYYAPKLYKELSPFEKALASGDLLMGGGGPSELGLHMITAPFAAGAGVAQVPVILEIAGKPLLESGGAAASQLQVYAYANDSSGTLTDYLAQEYSFDLGKFKPRLETGGIKFYGTLFLPPGNYDVRVLAREKLTGRAGVVSSHLVVPAVPGGDPVVLPPFFLDAAPPDFWIMVKASQKPSKLLTGQVEYPFAIQGDSFIAAARPVLQAGFPAQVAIVTFNLGTAGKPEPLQLMTEVLGSDGKPRKVDVQVVRRSDRERDGARAFLISFKPDGLEPGSYLLKVRVSDRVSRRTAGASSPFEVGRQ